MRISQLPNLFIATSGTPLRQQAGNVLASKVSRKLYAAQASVGAAYPIRGWSGSAHE